jgi:ATP synthase protein I
MDPTPEEQLKEAQRLERLKALDARLSQEKHEDALEQRIESHTAKDRSAMAQGFRLSAEFVSGIVAGTLLGWIIDQLTELTPWGLILGLLFGFGAGMLNLTRAAGAFPSKKKKQD